MGRKEKEGKERGEEGRKERERKVCFLEYYFQPFL
jgi:hypothetical protein